MSRHAVRLAPLDPPMVLFLLSAVLGVWSAYDRSLSWSTLGVLTAGFLLFVLISRLATPHRRWRAVALFIALTNLLLSLYFVAQYAHFGYPLKTEPVRRLVTLIGKVIPPAVIWAPTPHSVATFLEGGLFLTVALLLTEKRRIWRIGGGIAVALTVLAVLMSESRGAWLAVLATSILWLALHWRPARAMAIAGVLLSLGLAIYTVVQGDVTVLNDIPVANRVLAPLFIRPDRLLVYRNSLYLIQDFPLTGIGLGGQFAMIFSRYALLIGPPFLTYSHSLYLEVWLQQGLLGTIVWTWLIAAFYQATRTYAKPGSDLLHQGTWLGVTSILVYGLVDARQYVDLWCWFPFFALLGLEAAIVSRRGGVVPPRRHWVLPAGVAGAFLVALLAGFHPLPATWHANLGCLMQARADLQPALDDGPRAALRQQAVDHFRRAIEIAPLKRTAQQRLGLILLEETRFEEAVEHLETAWQADPDNTTTRKGLGLAYVWLGSVEKAYPLLENIPDIVYELNIWGWWWGTQQRMEQSLNAHRMSLVLEPDQPAVQERLQQLESELHPW